MRPIATIPLILWLALAPAFAGKKTPSAEEVDHVALAALLIRDGNWDRAATCHAPATLPRPTRRLKMSWL